MILILLSGNFDEKFTLLYNLKPVLIVYENLYCVLGIKIVRKGIRRNNVIVDALLEKILRLYPEFVSITSFAFNNLEPSIVWSIVQK